MKRYRIETGNTSGDEESDLSATSSPDELCCGESLQQGRACTSLDDSSRLTYVLDYTGSTAVETHNDSLNVSTMAKPAFDESSNHASDHPLLCLQDSPIYGKSRDSFKTKIQDFSSSIQKLSSVTRNTGSNICTINTSEKNSKMPTKKTLSEKVNCPQKNTKSSYNLRTDKTYEHRKGNSTSINSQLSKISGKIVCSTESVQKNPSEKITKVPLEKINDVETLTNTSKKNTNVPLEKINDIETLTNTTRFIEQPIPRKTKLKKNVYHNDTYSTPIYNVYPVGVSNPIFTNWKITTKKDKIALPPICSIQRGIIFKDKNIFVFSPINKDDIFNILSGHMRNLKDNVGQKDQKKKIQFLYAWITLLTEDSKKYLSLETIITFLRTDIGITSSSFQHPDDYGKFLDIIKTLTYMTAYDMPLLRTKPPQKKTHWLKQMSDIEYKFLIEALPYTKYILSDKNFVDVVVDKTEDNHTFHLAEDILDIKPIKAIEYCCEEIYGKLQQKAKSLVKKYNSNQCGHIFMMEMDQKCTEVINSILCKNKPPDMSSSSTNFLDLTEQDMNKKTQNIPNDGRTGKLIKFVKNTMINNPVWDLGLQLQTVSNSSKKVPYKDVYQKILPNMIICPCSELFTNFDKYHEVEVKIRCDKTYFTNTKKFVNHLKHFRQLCPNHAAVLDVISYLYPYELTVAVSKNPNLNKKKANRVVGLKRNKGSTTENNSNEFKINR